MVSDALLVLEIQSFGRRLSHTSPGFRGFERITVKHPVHAYGLDPCKTVGKLLSDIIYALPLFISVISMYPECQWGSSQSLSTITAPDMQQIFNKSTTSHAKDSDSALTDRQRHAENRHRPYQDIQTRSHVVQISTLYAPVTRLSSR